MYTGSVGEDSDRKGQRYDRDERQSQGWPKGPGELASKAV